MSTKHGILGVVAIALITLLISFAGLISDFVLGLARDIDGLLLLSVSLMTALIFAAMLYVVAKQAGWIGANKSAAGVAPSSGDSKAAPAATK